MAKILMVGNISCSDALRKLVAEGGSITRLHWRSEEYRRERDRNEGVREHVVAITARDLEVPDGTPIGTTDTEWLVHTFVHVVMYERYVSAHSDWRPGQPDLLAQDWEWYPPRRGT